jgi:DNA-binding CsgD family transcriptional regulator
VIGWPSLAEFMLHAQTFGGACVFETAAAYLDAAELARLRTELDAVEANRRGRSGVRIGKPRRVSELERTEQVRLLAAEGLPATEIAKRLGISARRVDRLLSVARNGHDSARATVTLASLVRAHKTPAQRGVKTGGLGAPELGSAMRPGEEASTA